MIHTVELPAVLETPARNPFSPDVGLQRLADDDLEDVLSVGVIGCHGDRLQQLIVECRLAVLGRIVFA